MVMTCRANEVHCFEYLSYVFEHLPTATTVGALEAGLFFGYVGMVEGLVRRMDDELGGNAICVATGGLASVIAPETGLITHVDVDLTLQGLRIVWERNQ